MHTQEEINALFEIFKSGTLENIELAMQLAQNSTVDLSLNHFEALFEYLSKVGAFKIEADLSLAQKIHQIMIYYVQNRTFTTELTDG